MSYQTELLFQTENLREYEVEKKGCFYPDRVVVADKTQTIFLLTTYDVDQVPEDYRHFVQELGGETFALSVNYIPVFFGGDYDDVVRVLDQFADQLKEDYQ